MAFRATIELAALRKAMLFCGSVSPATHTLPVVGHVMLTADGGFVRFVATDLSHEAEVTCDAVIAEGGSVCVPAHRLRDLANRLPDGSQVSLIEQDGSVIVTSGRTRLSLLSLSAEGYPRLSSPEGDEAEFSLPASEFAKALGGVAHAISRAVDRRYLCGACLHTAGQRLRAVGTDGYIFAWREIALPKGAELIGRPIIHYSTVALALKVLALGGAADVSISSNLIVITAGSVRLAAKLVDQVYPDYETSVRERTSGASTEVLTEIRDLRKAVDVSLTASGSDKSDAFTLGVNRDGWRLALSNSAVGESTNEVAAEVDGDEVEIRMNPRILTSALDGCSFETARAKMVKDTRVLRLTPISDNDAAPAELHLAFGMTF